MKVITNSGALSNVDNDLQGVKTMLGTVYSVNNAVKAVVGDYMEVCSLTLPTSGVYLVIAHAELSIADGSTIENLNLFVNNDSIFNVRTTASSGGGLNASAIYRCSANAKLWVQCYGYSQDTSCEHRAWIQALKLSD